jgi:hypothetical protein
MILKAAGLVVTFALGVAGVTFLAKGAAEYLTARQEAIELREGDSIAFSGMDVLIPPREPACLDPVPLQREAYQDGFGDGYARGLTMGLSVCADLTKQAEGANQ